MSAFPYAVMLGTPAGAECHLRGGFTRALMEVSTLAAKYPTFLPFIVNEDRASEGDDGLTEDEREMQEEAIAEARKPKLKVVGR